MEESLRPHDTDGAIVVQSPGIHLGDGLPDHAKDGIRCVAGKYFGRLVTASAHFGRDGSGYRCTVRMDMAGLPSKSADAVDGNIYTAFNTALAKVAKQLRRAKRELRENQPIRLDKDMAVREGLGLPPAL